jgi:hypothetical protein
MFMPGVTGGLSLTMLLLLSACVCRPTFTEVIAQLDAILAEQ